MNNELNKTAYRLIKEKAKNRAINSKLDALDSIITNTLEIIRTNKALMEENERKRQENDYFRILLTLNHIEYETDTI